jgi:Do/DeqQ family serine protease
MAISAIVLPAESLARRHGLLAATLLILVAAGAPAQTPAPAERAVPTSLEAVQLSLSPVVKHAAPAVVNIYAAKIVRTGPRSVAELFAQQFGNTAPARVERSLGSGVIVGADGVIVTNSHVVAGADEILVALADRREFKAKITFNDSRTDIAVLRVDTEGAKLPTVELADSDDVEVGDIVLAVGDPFGFGQTVTHGIISALARNGIGVSDRQFFIQTDAPINPGNSGGALLDMRGRLVGINSAIFSQTGNSVGIGFAIPSNIVRVVLNAAPSGKLVTGWIGAEGEGMTPATAKALGFDRAAGVIVSSVTAGSPAARAGLKPGDVITAVDSTPVDDAGQFRYRIATVAVGTSIEVTVVRAGATLRMPVKLIAPPETPLRELTPIAGNTILAGTTVANLSPAYAQQLGAGFPEHGIVVVEIKRTSPALGYAGLRPGDLIESVNGKPVSSAAEVATAAQSGTAALTYVRGPQRMVCTTTGNRFACAVDAIPAPDDLPGPRPR